MAGYWARMGGFELFVVASDSVSVVSQHVICIPFFRLFVGLGTPSESPLTNRCLLPWQLVGPLSVEEIAAVAGTIQAHLETSASGENNSGLFVEVKPKK